MNWAWHAEEYTTENRCIANINMAYSEWSANGRHATDPLKGSENHYHNLAWN